MIRVLLGILDRVRGVRFVPTERPGAESAGSALLYLDQRTRALRVRTETTDEPVGGTGGGGTSDHGALTGLSDDDHAQYALLAGRASGQTLKGGTASGEVLTLQSTAHATRGYVYSADRMVVGDPGSESAGIDINGTTYTAAAQFNEIGGGRGGIELHGHSTTHPIYVLGSRSNSNTSSHTAITTDMDLLTILATGWTGSHYDQCASIELRSGSGTIGSTSSPGEIRLRTTADGAQTPTTRMTIGSDGVVAVAGSMTLGTPLAAAQGGTGATALGDLAVSGGALVVTDLTISSEAHGDILYRGASSWVRLAAGTAGRVLTTQGAGAAPTWDTLGDLSAGIGDLADLLDGADVPNNEAWGEGWGWDGSQRVRAWVPVWLSGYKSNHFTVRPDTGSTDSVGWTGPTTASTSAVGEVGGVRYWQSANTGDSSIQLNGATTVLELGLVATVDLTFVMYSDITSIRHMVYVADQSPTTMLGASAPTSGSYIMLRYDTGAGDSTFQVICRDGSTTGAAVDTGITPAADTRYSWTLSPSPDASEVQVWVAVGRGARHLVATLDSGDNIPASGTAMRLALAAKALSGTKGVRLSSATVVAP